MAQRLGLWIKLLEKGQIYEQKTARSSISWTDYLLCSCITAEQCAPEDRESPGPQPELHPSSPPFEKHLQGRGGIR
jgi:hypothetical protein